MMLENVQDWRLIDDSHREEEEEVQEGSVQPSNNGFPLRMIWENETDEREREALQTVKKEREEKIGRSES